MSPGTVRGPTFRSCPTPWSDRRHSRARTGTGHGITDCAEADMRRTDPEGHGPVRYGPALPDDGLPVLPELSEVLAAAAGRAGEQPVGGGRALLDAACGYWARRGLSAEPDRVAAGPGAPPLLLA